MLSMWCSGDGALHTVSVTHLFQRRYRSYAGLCWTAVVQGAHIEPSATKSGNGLCMCPWVRRWTLNLPGSSGHVAKHLTLCVAEREAVLTDHLYSYYRFKYKQWQRFSLEISLFELLSRSEPVHCWPTLLVLPRQTFGLFNLYNIAVQVCVQGHGFHVGFFHGFFLKNSPQWLALLHRAHKHIHWCLLGFSTKVRNIPKNAVLCLQRSISVGMWSR